MTAPGADAVERQFEELLRDVNQGIDDAQRLTRELHERLAHIWDLLPPGFGTIAARAWQDFMALQEQLVDAVQTIIANPGYPPALIRIGNYWDKRVGSTVSGLHQALSEYGMSADDNWSGAAAEAYADVAEAQSRAVAIIKPTAEKVQNTLADLAWAMVGFVVAISIAVANFLAGMISACGLAAGVVTAPAAPIDAAAAAAITLGLITSAVAALTAYCTEIRGGMSTLRQAMNDNGGLVKTGDGWGWPTATGMAGDWHVRTG